MDILNWLFIRKQNLIKTTPDSTTDLLVLGADATFAKRGDKYKSYAMEVKDLVTQYDNAGTAGTFAEPIQFTSSTTLNGYTGRINIESNSLGSQSGNYITLLNDKIHATGTRVMLTCGYSGTTGQPFVYFANVSEGQMDIRVFNADAGAGLDANLIVTFEILPA